MRRKHRKKLIAARKDKGPNPPLARGILCSKTRTYGTKERGFMARGTIFFDYDGTLNETMRIYGPALRSAISWLEEEGYLEPASYSDQWISSWLGWSTKEMWNSFAPQLPQEIWTKAAAMVGQTMDELTAQGRCALFDGIEQTLDTLKAQGWTLSFLSNCRQAYRDEAIKRHGLNRWFSCYHCAEDYPGLAKWEIYQRVADDGSHPLPHIVVGDRFHDIEVGTKANIPSIGCRYGYAKPGELDAADICVDNPLQIPQAVKELLS